MASKEYANYKFLLANPETSGDNTLIPQTPGKKIVVVSVLAVSTGVVTIAFKSDSGVVSGDMNLIANSGFSICNPGGVFVSRIGGPLLVNLSANVKVGLTITYELI